MSTKFASNRKRVTLNKKPSTSDEQDDVKETHDYTRQLVESALAQTPLITSSFHHTKSTSPTAAINVPTRQQSPSRLHLLLEKNGVGDTLSPFSALKPSLRRPNSAPCTPVAKSVHFDDNLENICLFRKAQTPSTIRRGSVFWGKNDDGSDFGTSDDDESDQDDDEEKQEQEEQQHLVYANWPNRLADILNKKNRVIRVEKTNFRLNNSTVVGKVLVRNLDYHKTVMIRYTFDFWETAENVQAIYRESTNKKMYDVFGFSIDDVSDKPNAVLYFAVYYKVGDQEYWDNNDGKNYEIQIATSKRKPTTIPPSDPSFMVTHKEDGLSARYSFGDSMHQAKQPPTTSFTTPHHTSIHKSSSSPSLASLPDTVAVAMPIPRRKSANGGREPFPLFSSSPTSCHSPLASSPNSKMDLNSQSYMDLVNKYCFYSTSPSRSPMSING